MKNTFLQQLLFIIKLKGLANMNYYQLVVITTEKKIKLKMLEVIIQ